MAFNTYQIAANFSRGCYDSFPACYPATADLLFPVVADLLFQFSAGLCPSFSVSVNGLIQPWPPMCKISWVLFSFGTYALVQCPTDSPGSHKNRQTNEARCTAQYFTEALKKNSTHKHLDPLTRYRKTSAIAHLQTPVPKKDPCKS